MTEQEFKLKQKVEILEIELKDVKKRCQQYYDKYRELVIIVGRIALNLCILEKDRGTWSISKDNKDNLIYKTLGITDCVGSPFLPQK